LGRLLFWFYCFIEFCNAKSLRKEGRKEDADEDEEEDDEARCREVHPNSKTQETSTASVNNLQLDHIISIESAFIGERPLRRKTNWPPTLWWNYFPPINVHQGRERNRAKEKASVHRERYSLEV
jgi:hypothetical protein